MNQFLKRKAKEAAQVTEKEKKTKATVEELLEIATVEDAQPVETAPEEVVAVVSAPTVEDAEPKERKPRAKRHKAFNVFYDKATKKFMLVTIDYTIKTGYSSIVSVEPVADNWPTALGKIHNILALKLARGEDAE